MEKIAAPYQQEISDGDGRIFNSKQLKQLRNEIKLIIGLTGPISSGCTTTSRYLVAKHGFHRISISEKFIDTQIDGNMNDLRKIKQDFGDKKRKDEPAYFVHKSIEEMYKLLPKNGQEKEKTAKFPEYFVVECLRNHAEVLAFKKLFPEKFFLIAIYADYFKRGVRDKTNVDEFAKNSKRDEEHVLIYGQQVKRCVELADVFLSNNVNISKPINPDDPNDPEYDPEIPDYFSSMFGEFLRNSDVEYVIRTSLQENWFPFIEFMHDLDRVVSINLSLLSNCRKRNVGSVITKIPTTKQTIEGIEDSSKINEYIISGGWNQVILQDNLCRKDKFCFRKFNQLEHLFLNVKNCPLCKKKLEIYTMCRMDGTEEILNLGFGDPSKTRKQLVNEIKESLKCGEDHPFWYSHEEKAIIIKSIEEPNNEVKENENENENGNQARDIACGYHDTDYPRDAMKKFFPFKDLYHCQALHAEENAILNSSRFGSTSLADSVLYTTLFPCFLCTKKIIASGIRKVVYMEAYPDASSYDELMNAKVILEQFVGFTPYRYYNIFKNYFL
jgi:deoxycytidylate deaminase/dephospho-CoA kinase